MQGDVDWNVEITAKVPGSRAYMHYFPIDHIDKHSAENCGYWVERTIDGLRRARPGTKIIRIQMTGTITRED